MNTTREPETGLDLAARVVDRDAGPDPNTAIVVDLPDAPAYEHTIDELGESIADLNPEYPASGRVATVAFERELDDARDEWREVDPEMLAWICESYEVRTYTYPVDRLRPVEDTDDLVQGRNA